MFSIEKIIRKNIASLVPYSSARDEYSGEDAVFLDANENPYKSGANRYPDPLQWKLKQKISSLKKIPVEKIFLGNGSDEPIDLLIRAFCEPGKDNIICMKPTYGMYKVCADINGVEFREILLNEGYQLQVEKMLEKADTNSKILFLCSPNNPTSNNLRYEDMIFILKSFSGIVVADEAYIDFSAAPSLLEQLPNFPNLVVLQTFSKAWGMAGVRLGMAFAEKEIIGILNKIKYPYNINVLTQKFVLDRLDHEDEKEQWVKMILKERETLCKKLNGLEMVKDILASDANFLMVRFDDSRSIFSYLRDRKIIVRDRSKVSLCEGYLRFTIGTPEENNKLIIALQDYAVLRKSKEI